MLTYEQILELIDKLVETPLSEISVSQGDFAISLKKEAPLTSEANISTSLAGVNYQIPVVPAPQTPITQAMSQTPVPSLSNLIEVTSPMVGTFYAAPAPDAAPFVKIGQNIKPGDVLCIIEAMKMMNEFPAEVSGTIVEVCVPNAQTVEYGQVLFKIKPN
jgi:acetyl-CoA carboxylase biotin carboxyl carrier protein